MQTARTVYRPLLAQATLAAAGAAPRSHAALGPAAISFAYAARRSYATESSSDKNTLQEMQAKQMRLVDKMGRRKQTPAIVRPSCPSCSLLRRMLTWRIRTECTSTYIRYAYTALCSPDELNSELTRAPTQRITSLLTEVGSSLPTRRTVRSATHGTESSSGSLRRRRASFTSSIYTGGS